ncbi:polyamine ABC transporter permease [Streptosporangium violaceochromogenes]|nr:polyamine ABC transporter permease [Streptosporangium violaceochromogenes]
MTTELTAPRAAASAQRARRRRAWTPYALVTPAVAYLALVFVTAMLLVVSYSTRRESTAALTAPLDLSTWSGYLSDGYYWGVLGTTLRIALEVVVLTLLVAYPTAWLLSRMRRGVRFAAAVLVLFSPVLVSVVVRSYGWILLLADNGPIAAMSPVGLLYHEAGVVIALIHVELPFAVFPLMTVMSGLPGRVLEAAADLGAGPLQRFRRVVLPLSLPGVVAAAQIVFALTVSAFATPALLGGGRVQVLSELIYANIAQLSWPLAAVQAIVLLAVSLTVLATFNVLNRRVEAGRRGGTR